MADVCIICQKETNTKGAVKVRDDRIIGLIRKVKTATKTIQNNRLWVCSADMEEYHKRRKGFEKDIVLYGIISVGVVLVMSGLPLLGGRFDIGLLFVSLLIGGMLFFLGALLKYIPAIEGGKGKPETKMNETAVKEKKIRKK